MSLPRSKGDDGGVGYEEDACFPESSAESVLPYPLLYVYAGGKFGLLPLLKKCGRRLDASPVRGWVGC